MALGQYQPAVNDYSTVISNTPKYGAAYCGRARAYEKLGKQDLAEKDREKAKDLEYKPEQK
jgi:Tfp pilus assembly protein PilF